MKAEDVNLTTGLLFKNDNFVGSGVVFCINDILYCLTAGHTLYGKKFDAQPNLKEWAVEDHQGSRHIVNAINGDLNFANKYDIVLLKLQCSSSLENFSCPKFITAPKNPSYSLMFRGRYANSTYAVTQKKILYNGICPGNIKHFVCDIDRNLLTNDVYSSGSDWLGGWSGSGLFIEHHTELICAGILIEIPNKGNDGQLHFVNLEVLTELDHNLEILNSEALDYDQEFRAKSLESIFDDINEQAVNEWEENDLHKPQLDFINSKIPLVYAKGELDLQKRKIIKAILIGKSYLTAELKKNEELYRAFKNANNIYKLDNLTVYADTKPQARERLTAIKENYEAYLEKCLPPGFEQSNIKLLALYSVSEWIAVCSLSIMENE